MKWLKDPLLQFLLLGALIFAVYSWQQPAPIKQIRVPAELDAAAREQFINEAVLIREARKLGLDQNDSIINRQLQQKMRSLLEAVAQMQINDRDLADWITRHPERYSQSPRVDVVHRLFRRSQHPNAEKAAKAALAADVHQPNNTETDIEQLFNISQGDLRKRYGESFADAVFAAAGPHWQGPVSSGLGSHIFQVIEQHAAVPADFEKIKQRALTDWRAEQETAAFIAGLAELRKAYELIIND